MRNETNYIQSAVHVRERARARFDEVLVGGGAVGLFLFNLTPRTSFGWVVVVVKYYCNVLSIVQVVITFFFVLIFYIYIICRIFI